jgi:predicted RNase H-like nuclease
MTDINEILSYLNRHKIRATYGAVGDMLGIPAIAVGQRLGKICPEASWVVSASSGKPSGYTESDYHPALFEQEKILRRGDELRKILGDKINRQRPITKSAIEHPIGSSVVHQASGGSSRQIAGIDLAWISERNGSGIAIGTIHDGRVEVEQLHCGIIGLANVKNLLKTCPNLEGVAIDAPLIIQNTDGSRPCEKDLSKVYSSRWAGCHPSSKSRYPDASSVKLSKWLEAQGLNHLASGTKWQIEVYPHPAIIELFGLSKRHKYKKGTLEERRVGQIELASYIKTLGQSPKLALKIPGAFSSFLDEGHIHSLSGLGLKHNEDALDALICLYIAGLYASGEIMRVFGDVPTGYIVVPNRNL